MQEVDSEDSFKMQHGVKESASPGVAASEGHGVTETASPWDVPQGPGVSASSSVFAIDPAMFALKANLWPDYVMQTAYPAGLP